MPGKKQRKLDGTTPRLENQIYNDYFRKLVKEKAYDLAEQEYELAECFNVSIDQLETLVETDNFVTLDALFYLELFPDADHAIHNNYVFHFVTNEMVDWEREEFAETLGVTVGQLDRMVHRRHFLTDGAMDYMRGCSGMGLEVPVFPGHEVVIRRDKHDGTVDYLVEVIRCSDGAVIAAADERDFAASISEIMLLDGPAGCEDLDVHWQTRRFGLLS